MKVESLLWHLILKVSDMPFVGSVNRLLEKPVQKPPSAVLSWPTDGEETCVSVVRLLGEDRLLKKPIGA